MTKTPVPSAADILPKVLLSKLQKHCSGSIYIPAPQTQIQRNAARVRSLHVLGWKPVPIAEAVNMSAKQVREIVRQIEDGTISCSREYKVFKTVPIDIIEAVQKYTFGHIYVPAKVSEAARRRSIVQRLLRKGLPVSEVAKRSGLSERRVWQMKKSETELAQLEAATSTAGGKPNNGKRRDRFDVGPVVEPGYVPPKRCSVCGIPVGPDEAECDVCRYRAETKRNADSDVIILRDFPFAVINREF